MKSESNIKPIHKMIVKYQVQVLVEIGRILTTALFPLPFFSINPRYLKINISSSPPPHPPSIKDLCLRFKIVSSLKGKISSKRSSLFFWYRIVKLVFFFFFPFLFMFCRGNLLCKLSVCRIFFFLLIFFFSIFAYLLDSNNIVQLTTNVHSKD